MDFSWTVGRTYHLVMTFTVRHGWYRWLIEIDGKNLGLPKKNNFIVIFHGELLNNQRVNEIKMDMKTSMHLQLAQVENRKN